jgi:hypothetical protein
MSRASRSVLERKDFVELKQRETVEKIQLRHALVKL